VAQWERRACCLHPPPLDFTQHAQHRLNACTPIRQPAADMHGPCCSIGHGRKYQHVVTTAAFTYTPYKHADMAACSTWQLTTKTHTPHAAVCSTNTAAAHYSCIDASQGVHVVRWIWQHAFSLLNSPDNWTQLHDATEEQHMQPTVAAHSMHACTAQSR
jgi:hypothetical protein